MKNLITAFILLFIVNLFNSVLSQPEIWFYNLSSNNRTIWVKFLPAGMVFNGNYDYNLKAAYNINYGNWQYHYVAGVSTQFSGSAQTKHTFYEIGAGSRININHDNNSINSGCHLAVGFGLYMVEVWWEDFEGPPDDYFTLEYDAGYRLPPFTNADLTLNFVDDENDPRVMFKWMGSNGQMRNTRDVGKKLECWRQYETGTREKNPGDFKYGFGTTGVPNTLVF